VPLAAGGLDGIRGMALLAHLATLTVIVAAELRRRSGRAGLATRLFADLHLLLLIPLLYWELPLLMEGLPGPVVYRDPAVQAVEGALFGFQPAWELAGAVPLLWLSEILHLAYLLYYPIIYLPPLLLYVAAARANEQGAVAAAREGRFAAAGAMAPAPGDAEAVTPRAAWDPRADLQEALTALALSIVSCYIVFIVLPVQGPRYLMAPQGIPSGPFRALALAVLEGGSSRGAAFPSSHVAIAVTQTIVMLRFRPRLGRVFAGVTVLLALGAVYGGFHYAVDALAGAAFGAAAAWAARPLARRHAGAPGGFARAPHRI
jgi:membrane-associated phospholipid phosphatase